VTVQDDETAGIDGADIGGSISLTEGGATGTYDIKLSSQPTGDVEITATADGQTEISSDSTTFSNTVTFTFTTGDWNTAQTITVQTIDDSNVEGSHTSTITHAITGTVNDANYPDTLSLGNVTVNITDNDVAPPPPPPPPAPPVTSSPPPAYKLSLNKIGNGSLVVNNVLCNDNNNSQCTRYYGKEAVVITATPAKKWFFAGFSGDCDSTTVLMDTDKTCTAIFKEQYKLKIRRRGDGGGSLQINGVLCKKKTCTRYFGKEEVVITAIPNAKSSFDGFKNGDNRTKGCESGTVFMDADKYCKAFFIVARQQHSLTITVKGQGSVCDTCTQTHPDGSTINLATTSKVEPKPGWFFDRWAGDCDLQGKVVMTSDKTCSAIFLADPNVPNNGDGNDDGSKDSQQSHVVSIRDSVSGEYITLMVDEEVNITKVYTETDLAEIQSLLDDSIEFPQGIIYFEIEGSETDVTIYYHGLERIQNPIFHKYGPTTPGDTSTIDWYLMPNVIFGTVTIGGKSVVTAKYHLKDGELGDNTGVDGRIVDPGGISILSH